MKQRFAGPASAKRSAFLNTNSCKNARSRVSTPRPGREYDTCELCIETSRRKNNAEIRKSLSQVGTERDEAEEARHASIWSSW